MLYFRHLAKAQPDSSSINGRTDGLTESSRRANSVTPPASYQSSSQHSLSVPIAGLSIQAASRRASLHLPLPLVSTTLLFFIDSPIHPWKLVIDIWFLINLSDTTQCPKRIHAYSNDEPKKSTRPKSTCNLCNTTSNGLAQTEHHSTISKISI